MARTFHLHLVSDATGETLHTVAKAVCAQFEDVEAEEHVYALVRSERQLLRAAEQIAAKPGIVFFTLVNPGLRQALEAECLQLGMPYVSILDAPTVSLGRFLGADVSARPGGQHEIDQRYLQRIEAMNFTIQHDDGQSTQDLSQAEVVLVGASRTSKTPTCIYLAIRGVRAANVPIIPGLEPPESLATLKGPLIVGLYASVERLLQVRKNRLSTMGEMRDSSYVDEQAIRDEVAATRRFFERHDWPSIDVSRRSIEETAAAVLNLLTERSEA